MEAFTIPTIEGEWPSEEYFADTKELDDIEAALESVATRIEKRPESLFDKTNFGIFLSLIKKGPKIRADNRTRILESLKQGSLGLSSNFVKNHHHWRELPNCDELFQQFFQTVKCYAFLLQRIILSEDTLLKTQKPETNEVAAPTKRKGKKQVNEEAMRMANEGKVSSWHIETDREDVLSGVVSLIDLPLNEFFNVEKSLLNLFTQLAFQLLDNPLNSKSSSIRNSCIAIIRPLIVTYHHDSDCILRILHNFRTTEVLVNPIIDLIVSMKHEQAVLPFVNKLMLEISKIQSKDFVNNLILTKNIAALIPELSTATPKIVLPSVSLIISLLDQEMYNIRSGVVQALGTLIVDSFLSEIPADENNNDKSDNDNNNDDKNDEEDDKNDKNDKNGENDQNDENDDENGDDDNNDDNDDNDQDVDDMDEEDDEFKVSKKKSKKSKKSHLKSKKSNVSLKNRKDGKNLDQEAHHGLSAFSTREALLEILLERFLDVSAYTRARVLQTWQFVCSSKAIPVSRYLQVTKCCFERLSDKTAQVRKSAIELMNSLIENNPYGPNLSMTVWKSKMNQIKDEEKNEESEKKKRSKQLGGLKSRRSSHICSSGASTQDPTDSNPDIVDSNQDAVDSSPMEVDLSSNEDDLNENELFSLTSDEIAVSEQKKRRKQHVSQAIQFIQYIDNALPCVIGLLGSKVVGDVTEAIKLLAKAHTFSTEKALEGVRTVLMLVCSKDAGIKEAATQAYVDLYLTPKNALSSKEMPLFIARNLIELTHGASLGQLTSLEELLKELISEDRISPSLLPVLMTFFQHKQEQRVGALIILTMLADTYQNALQKAIPQIIHHGLGKQIVDEPLLAKWTCIALQKIKRPSIDDERIIDHDEDDFDAVQQSKAKKSAGKAFNKKETNMQAPFNAATIMKIANFLTLSGDACPAHLKSKSTTNYQKSELSAIETSAWYPAAEQAINAIYALSDAPSIVLSDVVKKMAASLQETSSFDLNESSSQSTISGRQASSSIIGRIIFVLGHIALKQLVFIEEIVGKKQLEKSKMTEKKAKNENKKSRSKRGKNNEDEEDDDSEHEAIELELGAVGTVAAGETHEEERARLYAQHSMVTKRLIGSFLPIIVSICNSEYIREHDPLLHEVAVHSLSKCMLVSSDFCKAHMNVIINLLSSGKKNMNDKLKKVEKKSRRRSVNQMEVDEEAFDDEDKLNQEEEEADLQRDQSKEASPKNTREASMRGNLVILLGDIAMRFPNLFENYSVALYEQLADSDPHVRKIAIVVVSHLILTSMIKPRGHMSDIAVCLEDEDTSIVDATRLFFKELAAKDNAFMSLLPDTISSLYRTNIDFETAKNILGFLLSFVDLQRDMAVLVEKLCQQFSNSTKVESWRYLSYCISTLNHTEATLEKLHSKFKLYKDALHDSVTLGYFLATTKARKGKPSDAGTKSHGELLEEKLLAIKEGDYVQDFGDPENETAQATTTVRKRGRKPGKNAAPPKRKRQISYSDDDTDDESAEQRSVDEERPTRSKKPRTAAAKPATKKTSSNKRRLQESDSDVELIDESE